jgi:hypothetical protein
VLVGDAAKIKQGDDFLSQIIPIISPHGLQKERLDYYLWDESELDGPKIIKVEWKRGKYGRAGSHCEAREADRQGH